jgi:hypothetical protein
MAFATCTQGRLPQSEADMTAAALAEDQQPNTPLADGRRERRRSSRTKIGATMLDLVGKGDVSPIATHLPASMKTDVATARGLNVILSFQTWRLLRHDQEGPVEKARTSARRLLADAMAAPPDA